jgi:hypothetical protein
VRSVDVVEPGVTARDAGSVRGDLGSGAMTSGVRETIGTRRVGFGRVLSTDWARGVSASLGVLPPEGGVVGWGMLPTGMVVIGGPWFG